MQLNLKITDWLFELSEIESQENCHYLVGDGTLLRNNLLKLYRATVNPTSHELIIKIMSEAGYPWFEKLARPCADSTSNISPSVPDCGRLGSKRGRQTAMSERDFLSLLPVSELVH